MRIGKRKLKWPAYVLFAVIILIIVIPIIIVVTKKHNSIEYKLENLGYKESEIDKIKELNNDAKEYILSNTYNQYYIDLINYKYFNKDLFLDYIKYHNELSDYTLEQIVSYVATESYKEEYEEVEEADLSDPYLVLVNKTHYLSKDYVPENIKNVSNWYAYEGRKLENTAYENYIAMFNDAKEEGLNLILNNGYRSYKDQKELFDTYKNDYGERQADSMTTRPGYHEYQTGLALNIFAFYGDEDFEKTKEYSWLVENAHNYGFILRYPEGKEYITKYEFEPYHFRYVGVEAATTIYNENLTLEEYRAFYLK